MQGPQLGKARVITPGSTLVAPQHSAAIPALTLGNGVPFQGATLVMGGGGGRAVEGEGNDLGGHQAYCFAWSQVHRPRFIPAPRAAGLRLRSADQR